MKKIKLMLLVCLSAIALTCIGAFTACGGGGNSSSKPPSAVNASTITYDGSVFQWAAVSNASSYLLTINGNEKTSYSALYTWSALVYDEDAYVITIVAQNAYGSSDAVTAEFYKLDTIEAEDLTFDETGVMSWTPVTDAVSYIVEVNNTEYPVASTTFSDFVYGGKNSIRVKAVGATSSYFAMWTSSAVTKTYLGTPANIKYDGQYITWTAGTASNTTYSIYINGSLYASGVSGTSYAYDSYNYDFDVSVQADGNGVSVYPSKVSDETSFVFLGEVTNIAVNEDGFLQWDAIDKATSYELQIIDGNGNLTTKTTTGTTYELSSGASITVKIKPLADNSVTYFSTWSEEVTVSLLNSPTLLWHSEYALTDGAAARALYWNTVSGDVAAYNIKIVYTPSGSTSSSTSYASTTATNPSFEYAYLGVGTYEISVQSVASIDSDWSNSTYSTAITVIRLAAPNQNATNFVVSDATDVSNGFTVYYTSVSGATSYRLIKDGASTDITSSGTSMKVTQVVTDTVTETQTTHYAIQSVGGIKSLNGTVVTLASLTADSLEFTITVLPVPENVEINGDNVTWDTVTSARGYAVNYGVSTSVSNPTWSLQNITTAGEYSLKVCSKGDGAMVLPSNYTAAITVVKLAAPTNIRINTNESEGSLSWTSVQYASSYNIYLNGSSTPIADSQIDNMNNHITATGGVAVVMETVANYWNEAKTVYYANSEKSDTVLFTKLNIVTFPSPAFVDNTLVWNAPSNVGTNANVTYRVYIDGYVSNGEQDGTSMDISSLAAGTHSFYIKCIGDGTTYINSEVSATISITKLATPTVTRSTSATAYVWDAVDSAQGYQVYVDGTLAETINFAYSVSTYSYTPNFDSIKTYTVQVYAIGDGGKTTINSSAAEIKQTVSKLVAPTFEAAYSNPSGFVTGGAINITITAEREYATGYTYIVEGIVTETLTATTYSYVVQDHGTYVVTVIAVGGKFDENGTYWYTSAEQTSYTITIFNTPTKSNIYMNASGVILGFTVSGVSSYDLIVTYKDGTTKGTEDEPINIDIASYKDENYSNIASVKIRCHGNGTTTISSEWVTWDKS